LPPPQSDPAGVRIDLRWGRGESVPRSRRRTAGTSGTPPAQPGNAGALSETPLTEIVWAFPWISIPLLLKSGKFGTRLARMHFEKASVEPVELEPLPVDAREPELLGCPRTHKRLRRWRKRPPPKAACGSERRARSGRVYWTASNTDVTPMLAGARMRVRTGALPSRKPEIPVRHRFVGAVSPLAGIVRYAVDDRRYRERGARDANLRFILRAPAHCGRGARSQHGRARSRNHRAQARAPRGAEARATAQTPQAPASPTWTAGDCTCSRTARALS